MTWFRRRRPRRYTQPELARTAPAPLDGDTSATYMRRLHLSLTVLRAEHARMQAGHPIDPAAVCMGLVEVAEIAMTTRSRVLTEQAALASVPDYPPEEA